MNEEPKDEIETAAKAMADKIDSMIINGELTRMNEERLKAAQEAKAIMDAAPAPSPAMKPDCSKCHAPELCCSQRIGLDKNEFYRLSYIGGANAQYDLRTGGGVLNPDGEQCKFHVDGACSIYLTRPKVCAEWHCLDMEGWVARERQLKR